MRYIQGMVVNGVALRTPCAQDAAQVLAMMKQAYGETDFLSTLPEEFDVTEAEEAVYLQKMEASVRRCMIGAWIDGKMVGNASISAVSERSRLKHRARLGIAVLKDFWGRGVGSMLMDAALQTAESAGYRQVELEVYADNARAIALYERFGFEEYGRCPQAARRSYDAYVDEVLMVKKL